MGAARRLNSCALSGRAPRVVCACVQAREFASQDNAELYAEEMAAQRYVGARRIGAMPPPPVPLQ
eukprot:scaffold1040_cov376-Prasinococcus_capsulatus_cf.AAC.5